MPQRKFANQKALIDYAEQNGLVYVGLDRASAGDLARLHQTQAAALARSVRDCGCAHISWRADAMLFPKAILQAEFAANAPLGEVLAIQRERWRAKRAEKQRTT